MSRSNLVLFSDLQPFLISRVFLSLSPITSFSHSDVIASEGFVTKGMCQTCTYFFPHLFPPSTRSSMDPLVHEGLQHEAPLNKWRSGSPRQGVATLFCLIGLHRTVNLFEKTDLQHLLDIQKKRFYPAKEKLSYHLYPKHAKFCFKESVINTCRLPSCIACNMRSVTSLSLEHL